MFKIIKKLLHKKTESELWLEEIERRKNFQPKRIWKAWEHKGWGDSIGWIDFSRRCISGHLTPKPKVGDEFQTRMDSGKIGRFKIISVEYCSDPNDMFFATVSDIGYTDGTFTNFR